MSVIGLYILKTFNDAESLSSESNAKGISAGLVVGIVIGATVFVTVIVAIATLLVIRHRNAKAGICQRRLGNSGL